MHTLRIDVNYFIKFFVGQRSKFIDYRFIILASKYVMRIANINEYAFVYLIAKVIMVNHSVECINRNPTSLKQNRKRNSLIGLVMIFN